MKKLFLKIVGVSVSVIRTGSIFQENDLILFVVKGAFLLVLIVVIYRNVISERTIKFLEQVRKFW